MPWLSDVAPVIVGTTLLLYYPAPGTGTLFFSISETGGSDSFGNTWPQGINFIAVPGLTNIFTVEDTSGNTLASIDSLGNITGQTLTANTDIILAGESLDATLDNLPGGCIAQGQIAQTNLPYPATPVNTEQLLFELDVQLTAGRIYQMTVEAVKVALSTAGRFQVTGRFTTDGSAPTTGSPILFQVAANHDGNEDFNIWSPPVIHMEVPASNLLYRIVVTASTIGTIAADGKPTWQVVGNITGNEMRTMINDLGLDPGNTALWLGGGSGGGGTPKNHTLVANATDTYAYEGTNADSSPNPGFSPGAKINHNGNAFQGDDQLGDNGNTSTMIVWPSSVASTLSAANVTSINSITLTMTNKHSWFNSGMSVAIGKHNGSAGGATRPTYTDPDLVEGTISEGAQKTFSLNSQLTAFANALSTGQPFVLYHPGSSRNYYGYFSGGGSFQITVKYTTSS